MKKLLISAIAFSLCTLASANENPGKQLAAENCLKCHGTEVYTRLDRKMLSLQSLDTQVRRCEANLELGWFDDEIDAVTQFLNQQYYHF